MNYISDLVLNFKTEFIDFYEWDKTDEFTYIEKIPIYRVCDISMKEIFDYKIKVSKDFLKEIYNKTYTSNNRINYSILVTDMNRVIALKFNDEGELIGKSGLLIDEEDAVIEEVEMYDLEIFDYTRLDDCSNYSFLTRKEKNIKNSLLKEINYLYREKNYEEINYLYYEIFSIKKSIKDEYNSLIDLINNNCFNEIYNLDKIVKMIKEKSY